MAVVTISSSPTMLQCRICDIICSFRYVTILTIFQVPREELHPRLFPIRLVLRGAGQRREGGTGESEQLQRYYSDILRVSQLQKKFRHLEAVRLIFSYCLCLKRLVSSSRQLTFGVKSGECFGLLGINGAGKTTTFRWGK